MKYLVNDNCIGCGLCNSLCPDVYEMGDDGLAHAKEEDVDPSLEDAAKEGMNSCPVAAIEEA
ncbi:MAG TPA: ferredoxin [Lachnospiraceae bacterium]|nr:ferredoxin [Lachnospiraceae bacterium]